MNRRCDEIYSSIVSNRRTGDQSLFDMADCFRSGYDPDKLSQMLKSSDDGIVSDALFIIGEIGVLLASEYKDELTLIANSNDEINKADAEKIISLISKSD